MTLILSGESLYRSATHPDAAPWSELDEVGKAIWRDAEQLIGDRLRGDADYVTTKFSKRLVERMGDWGTPVQCKLEPLPDGTVEMWCRYPGGEMIPDKVVRAACEQLYGTGCTGEKFMAGARAALEAALLAWRP